MATDIQRFRLDSSKWEAFGALVGDRGRSAQLQDFVDWRLANPDTPLPTSGGPERVHEFVVRVHTGGREVRAEVEPVERRRSARRPRRGR